MLSALPIATTVAHDGVGVPAAACVIGLRSCWACQSVVRSSVASLGRSAQQRSLGRRAQKCVSTQAVASRNGGHAVTRRPPTPLPSGLGGRGALPPTPLPKSALYTPTLPP